MSELATVLVVEDEPDLREIMCRLLRRGGYTVLSAGSAAEALRLLQSTTGRLDLLLSDLGLPGTHGFDLAEAARQRRSGLAVLFVSGTPRSELIRAGLLPDGTPVVQKPFTGDTLLAAVRTATGAH